MGNKYTTQTKVVDELLEDIEASVLAKIDGWIEDESRTIDAALPNHSTPFADIAGSPATPPVIEKIARFLVVERVLRKIGVQLYDDQGKLIVTYKKEADSLLKQLREGTMVIPGVQLPAGKKPMGTMPGATSASPQRVFTDGQFSQW